MACVSDEQKLEDLVKAEHAWTDIQVQTIIDALGFATTVKVWKLLTANDIAEKRLDIAVVRFLQSNRASTKGRTLNASSYLFSVTVIILRLQTCLLRRCSPFCL
eukprot:GILJ01011771.1.p3 GENE.GILJ01011771.1~~GILJ01011771.1.p3  ORF type:complete len:104 (+),score=10.51 GILJ01011771.1:507-818(+)